MLGQEQPAPVEKLKKEKIGNPEKFLMSTGHFKCIEYPNSDQTMVFGRDISEHYKEIESIVPEDDRWMLIALVDYIKAPLVVDNFLSEKKRNAFQKREVHQHSEVNSLFELNKLKGNFISNIFGIAHVAELDDWLEDGIIEEYTKLYKKYTGPNNSPPSGYDNMTIEEKIAFTVQIANLAKSLYQAIASRYISEIPK